MPGVRGLYVRIVKAPLFLEAAPEYEAVTAASEVAASAAIDDTDA